MYNYVPKEQLSDTIYNGCKRAAHCLLYSLDSSKFKQKYDRKAVISVYLYFTCLYY